MALDHGQEWIPQDEPRLLEYRVNFGGLYAPGIVFAISSRIAQPNRSIVATDVWLKYGVVIGASGYQQLGDNPWGSGQDNPLHLAQFRKHASDGTLTRRMLFVISNAGITADIYELNAAHTAWTKRGSFTTPDIVTSCQAGNRLFLINGTDRKYWDGATFGNVVQAAPAVPTLNADPEDNTASGVLIATRIVYVGYTFFSSTTGDETLLSSTLRRVFVGAGTDNTLKVDFPAATPDSRFDYIKVYRSEQYVTDVPLATLRYEQKILWNTAGLTDQAVGIVADSLLTDVAPTVGSERDFSAMPTGRGIIFWDGRLWVYGMKDKQTQIAFSYRDSIIGFAATNALELADRSGLPIKCLFPYLGRMYAFTDEGSWEIDINPVFASGVDESAPPYTAKPISGSYGAGSPMAVCEAWGKMYGYCHRRRWISDGYNWQTMSEDTDSTLPTTANQPIVDFTSPAELLYQKHPDHEHVVLTTYQIGNLLVNKDGSVCKFSAGKLKQVSCIAQSDLGLPWFTLAGRLNSGFPIVRELYDVGTTGAVISANSVPVYETIDLDPDSSIVDKDFVYVDVCICGQGTDVTVKVAYDGTQAFLPSVTTSIPVGTDDYKVIRQPLPRKGPHQTLNVHVTLAPGAAMIWCKLWWKPMGDTTRT